MTATLLWTGAFSNGIGVTLTPPVGGTYQAGDSLIQVTGEYMGTQTIADPGSYTRISNNVNAQQTVALLKTAASGSETIPPITWGTASVAWSIMLAYRGLAAQASVLDITKDRAANVTSGDLFGPAVAITPSQSNSVVLFIAHMNKTSVTNSQVYTPPSGFSIIAQQVLAGTKSSVVICHSIQSSPVTIPANSVIAASLDETVAQSHQGVIIVLKPAATTFAPYPPRRPSSVFTPYDTYE